MYLKRYSNLAVVVLVSPWHITPLKMGQDVANITSNLFWVVYLKVLLLSHFRRHSVCVNIWMSSPLFLPLRGRNK